MKPYQQIPISDCGDPLVPIPLDWFAVEHPHPYVKVAAPYGDKSPYYLRQGVLQRLMQAQRSLQQIHSGWRIQIFDAYRPIAVQQYMVDYSFAQQVATQGLCLEQLTDRQRQEIWQQVYQFWAVPNLNPATPPPHSTGAAVDVTLVDAIGTVINMGSPIDEMSPRSYPNYFATAIGKEDKDDRFNFHNHRQLLKHVMEIAEFRQHPREWWHFSFGDQLWAWLVQQETPELKPVACYGAV